MQLNCKAPATQAAAFAETEASTAIVRDKLLESRMSCSLVSNNLGVTSKDVYTSLSTAFVKLYGSTPEDDAALSIERLIEDIHGVRFIENEILDARRFAGS